jgi:DNA-binding GntR family transcriptional regulator
MASKSSGKLSLLDDIKRRVLTMALQPGESLDEVQLSQEYGISRTPLRDVFRELAGEGYLELRVHQGARVTPMTHKSLRDFFQVAPMMYAAVGRLAAQHANSAQIRHIKSVQRHFRAALNPWSANRLVFHNNQFHMAIGEMAGNDYLMPSLRRLLIDHARISQTFYREHQGTPGDHATGAADQHDDIIAAIEARDPDLTVQRVLAHWELARQNIESYVRPDPLSESLAD